jgi:hypothetical protein
MALRSPSMKDREEKKLPFGMGISREEIWLKENVRNPRKR